MPSGDKPEEPKVEKTKTTFKGVNAAQTEGPFGTGTSQLTPYQATNPITGKTVNKVRVDTTNKLNPELQASAELAQTGLKSNLGFLQRNPNEQVDWLRGGNDPLYNILREESQRNTDRALGRSLVDSQGTGTMNSTTAGAAQGMILNDAILRSNQNLLQALNFGNETSRANMGANLNAIGSLANLVYPLGSSANANLLAGLNAQDRAYAATAAAQNAANLQHAQAMNAYNQQKASSWGNILGGITGVGTSLLLNSMGVPMGMPSTPVPMPNYGFNSTPSSIGVNDPNFTNLSIS